MSVAAIADSHDKLNLFGKGHICLWPFCDLEQLIRPANEIFVGKNTLFYESMRHRRRVLFCLGIVEQTG